VNTQPSSFHSAPAFRAHSDAASGQTLTYTYDTMNRLSQIAYSGGDTRQFSYYPLGRLTSDEVETASNARVGEIDYGYNAASELTSKNEYGISTGSAGTKSTNTYGYDEAGRLTSWTNTLAGGSAHTTGYGYDGDGNRTSVNGVTYSYDLRDELTSDGTNTYTYDARGTELSKTVTATGLESGDAFDAYGQDVTAGTTTYTYDALGRVLTAGTTTLDLQRPGQHGRPSDGTTTYSRDTGGTITGVSSTALGKTAAWTDQHTDLVATFASGASTLASWTVYDPLGNTTATNGTQNSLGYQSGYTDTANGQVNMGSRWYSPGQGQFISADTTNNPPYPNVDNANPYAYADASPLTGTDPSGHCGWCLTVLGGSIADDWNPTGWAIGAVAGIYLGATWLSHSSLFQTCSGCDATSAPPIVAAPPTNLNLSLDNPCVMNSYASWLATCPGAAAPPVASSPAAGAGAAGAGGGSGGGGYMGAFLLE
jgi:RHS repeat-associated protein